MLKSYPKEIRDRARELFLENPELSYSDIAQILYEEFPDKLSRPPNKTTIRNWVKDLRDKKYNKTEEKTEPIPEPKESPAENPKNDKVKLSEDLPPEFKELPVISPPEIAERLASKSTVVEENTEIEDIEEIVDEDEGTEEEENSFLSKIPRPSGKITMVILAVTVIGLLLYLIFRRKKEDKAKTYASPMPPKTQTEKKDEPDVVEL